MKKNKSYDVFLETLLKRFPEKRILVARLIEILHLEKEVIYRRLRGTVPFSFAEIITMAIHFDISLDNILALGTNNLQHRPLRLTVTNYWDLQEIDYFLLNEFVEDLKGLSRYPNSEFITIANTLPQQFCLKYENIYRFYLFKWQYENEDSHNKLPFKEVIPTQRLKDINRDYLKYSQEANNITFIWDKNTLPMLVQDIRYFYEIRLISEEELMEIHKDLNSLIRELESITMKGKFENGKKIQFYISHISIKGSYSILAFNPNYKACLIKWFTLNDTMATDELTYLKMKNWMSSLQRTSTRISESGEIQRIQFFEEQRQIVNSLGSLYCLPSK